jgi:hypothetical protein
VNFLHGVSCPSVVKVRAPKPGEPPKPIFEWEEKPGIWLDGDELPAHIAAALPGPEWSACEAHRIRRLGCRRAA